MLKRNKKFNGYMYHPIKMKEIIKKIIKKIIYLFIYSFIFYIKIFILSLGRIVKIN